MIGSKAFLCFFCSSGSCWLLSVKVLVYGHVEQPFYVRLFNMSDEKSKVFKLCLSLDGIFLCEGECINVFLSR